MRSPFNHGSARVSLRCPLLALVLLATMAPAEVQSLPRFALLSGTRCSGCHVNIQGGGPRNELGWSAMNAVGAWTYDEVGLDLLMGETNQFAEGLYAFGFDARLQVAKLGRPPDDKRKVIPMQVAPSVTVVPIDWLTIYAQYNAGPLRYPGQTSYEAAAIVQPDFLLPSLKVGHFQPTIGLRWDDHTLFVRRDPAGTGSPIIPPNHAEFGAEISYEGDAMVSATAGIFASNNLARANGGTDSTKPAFAARLMLWPQLLEEGINTNIGASVLLNDRFTLVNAFAGVGLADLAGIEGEVAMVRNGSDLRVRNISVTAYWQLWTWLVAEGRIERGESWPAADAVSTTAMSYVAGLEFFPLPYIELRPEYRYLDTREYTLAQYAVQLHVFY